MPATELITRLLLAALLGSLIGLERERLHWVAGLRTHMERMVADGFIDPAHAGGLLVEDDAARLLDRLAAWRAPTPKWADGPPP